MAEKVKLQDIVKPLLPLVHTTLLLPRTYYLAVLTTTNRDTASHVMQATCTLVRSVNSLHFGNCKVQGRFVNRRDIFVQMVSVMSNTSHLDLIIYSSFSSLYSIIYNIINCLGSKHCIQIGPKLHLQ